MRHQSLFVFDIETMPDTVSSIENEGAQRPHLNGFMDAWGQAPNNRFTP